MQTIIKLYNEFVAWMKLIKERRLSELTFDSKTYALFSVVPGWIVGTTCVVVLQFLYGSSLSRHLVCCESDS